MDDWSVLSQLVLSGLTTGCIYALVALGFVLCANVSGVINFAQGEFVVFGSLIAASLVAAGVPTPLALAVAVAAGATLGAAQERFTLSPVRAAPHFILITITLGVSVLLRGLALIIWDKDPIGMPQFGGTTATFELLGAVLPVQSLWVWGLTALLFAVTFWFLKFTRSGRAVRACSINPYGARLMGINLGRTTVIVFAVSGALGALGGAVIAPIALGQWNAGLDYGLKGFIGAVLGGFSRPGAAVLGGLAIGVIELLAAGYVSSGAKDMIVYGLLLAYLLLRGGALAFGRAALARI